MNDKYEERIEALRTKLGIRENDKKYISIDRNYCYLPPNTLIARKTNICYI